MRERGFILWFVLIAVLVVLLNLEGPFSVRMKSSLRELVAPLQEAVSLGTRKVSEAIQAVKAFGEQVELNERMQEDLVKLRNEVLTLQGLEKENIELREQLLYGRRSDRDLVSCEIIARDVSGWWQTVRLGKGYLEGIQPGMAVITPDGLVGKTIDVSPRTTDVLLISDSSCRVSVHIGRIGAFGVFMGGGSTDLGDATGSIDFISKNADVRVGDKVVTSGLGGVFPKGLLVGEVTYVEKDRSGLSQTAGVVAKADIVGLTHVFVVVEERDRINELLMERGNLGRARP